MATSESYHLVRSHSDVTTSSGCSQDQEPVIVKTGWMRKLKTMRKKYFVLIRRSDHQVWLHYFDSVRKFESNSRFMASKKAISITHCFSINQKPAMTDKKKQFVIDIFTMQDCFSVVFENESELTDWLEELRKQRSESLATLRKIQSSDGKKDEKQQQRSRSSDDENGNQDYSHVWQVSIAKKGLGLPPHNMTGLHRICLTPKMLHVYKVDPSIGSQDELIPLEIQLNSIRKCARTALYFSIELGRGCGVGPGELCMETEDPAIARHMHETIREAMRQSAEHSNNSSSAHHHRPRSASSSDGVRIMRRSTINSMHASATIYSLSGSQRQRSSASTLTQTLTGTTTTSTTTGTTTSNASIYSSETGSTGTAGPSSDFRDRCDSEPAAQSVAAANARSRCVSETQSAGSNQQLHYTTVSAVNHRTERLASTSPHHHPHLRSGTMSPTSATNSTESFGSLAMDTSTTDYPEMDLHLQHIQQTGISGPLPPPVYTHREVSSVQPSQPSIMEQEGEDSAEGYMVMDVKQPVAESFSSSGSTSVSRATIMARRHSTGMHYFPYVPMSSATASPVQRNSPMANVASGASVRDGATAAPVAPDETDTYVDMSSPAGTSIASGTPQLNSRPESESDDGYLNMAPIATALPHVAATTSSSSTHNLKEHGSSQRRRSHRHSRYQDNEPPEPPRESLEKLTKEFPLPTVKSFFLPAQESPDPIPVRAYSIGSRPTYQSSMSGPPISTRVATSGSGSMLDQSHKSSEAMGKDPNATDVVAGGEESGSRVRAHSTGSSFLKSNFLTGAWKQGPFRLNSLRLRKRAVTQESLSSNCSNSNAIPETSHESWSGTSCPGEKSDVSPSKHMRSDSFSKNVS